LNELVVHYVADSKLPIPFIAELMNRNIFILKKIRKRFDVIISHNLPCCFVTHRSYATNSARKLAYIHDPVQFTVAGNLFHLLFKFSSLKKRMALNWLEDSDVILVNSKRSQKILNEELGLKSIVLYPTITSFSNGLPNERKEFFLSVGRIGAHPTYQILLQILKRVKEMKLVIAGSSSHTSNKIIEMFSDSETIAKRVQFVVDPNDKELKNLYRSARAFLYPGTENFNMSALEAASNGCPIIISKESGIYEIIETKHLYAAEQNDIGSFCEIVNQFLYDENKALIEGKRLYEILRKYDSEFHMTRLLEIIEGSCKT
jgi:glycosyltransferase involved in cell wall biosynthesis